MTKKLESPALINVWQYEVSFRRDQIAYYGHIPTFQNNIVLRMGLLAAQPEHPIHTHRQDNNPYLLNIHR